MSTAITKRESIFTTIIRAFQKLISNPEEPEHGASYAAPYGVRQQFSAEDSMSAYAGHAYTHACATRASQDLAALPLIVINGRGSNAERIEEHAFYDLMDQPNSQTDGFLFREQLMIDLMLSGNCYILIVGPLNNPSSLFRLHPDSVEVVTNQKAGLEGYKYTDGGVSVQYPIERILHTRNASWATGASGELYGTGAIESLAREINADINAQKLASDTSAQGRPDILLSPKDDADIWGRERRREILDSYRNMSSRGGAMVLSGQVDVKPLNLSPREMEFQASREMARENISAVMGVPSTVLGLPDANYATARQATLTYWQVQSKRGRKMELLFTRIAKMFDDRFRVRLDYSEVEALQDLKTAKLARVEKHILIGGMDPSDAYAYEGLDDAPLGDVRQIEETEDEERNIESVHRLFEIIETEEVKKKLETRGSVGDVYPTNFPNDGDDKKVALRNSDYDRFPWKEALDLKENYPQIWNKGGNILGNTQFNRLYPIAKRSTSIAQTETEEKAIRLREAWAARHEGDFRLAGVVAQIKWLVVGDRGIAHMRSVISEAKSKLKSKSFAAKNEEEQLNHWRNWMQKTIDPTEKQFERIAMRYLTGAKGRYLARLPNIMREAKSTGAQETRAIDWVSLLARATEIKIIKDTIGRFWNDTWILTGNEEIDNLYNLLDYDRPADFLFGDRSIADRSINALAQEIQYTTEKKIKKIVEFGIEQGASNAEIADQLERSAGFRPSRARLIAQTETTSAVNRATNQAYVRFQEEEPDIQIMKQWIASGDANVRELHRILGADATKGIIPADKDFSISGYVGPAPAAFDAPEMDINCRCTLAPIVRRKDE